MNWNSLQIALNSLRHRDFAPNQKPPTRDESAYVFRLRKPLQAFNHLHHVLDG